MKKFILAIILIVGAMFLMQQALALTVSPVRFETEGYPGQTLVGEIKLFNEQPITRVFYSSFMNFEARGEGGEPRFLPGVEGLATWMTTAYERVSLEPGERKTIPFEIKIPLDADPGGHFSVAFWSTAPPEIVEGGQIAIGAKLGVLILLDVYGDIVEDAGILEFQTKQRILTHLPITFFYRFVNDGDGRVMPKGEIKVKDIFGREVVTLDANLVLGNVLPRSIRRFEVIWEAQNNNGDNSGEDKMGFWDIVRHQWRNFVFGMYTAELNLSWGEDMTAEASWRFFIIPWQLLSIIIIILIIISLLVIVGLKRYNRWMLIRAGVNSIEIKKIKKIKKGTSIVVKIKETDIIKITILAKQDKKNIILKIQEISEKPFEVSKIENIEVYQYFNIWANIKPEYIDAATIEFKVSQLWINKHNIDIKTIRLNRFNPLTNKWNFLSAKIIKEHKKYIIFSAQISHFSIFGITGKKISSKTISKPKTKKTKKIKFITKKTLSKTINKLKTKKNKKSIKKPIIKKSTKKLIVKTKNKKINSKRATHKSLNKVGRTKN